MATVGTKTILKSEIEKQYIQSIASGSGENEDLKCNIFDQLLLQKRVEYCPIDNLSLDSPSADDDKIVVFSHPSMKSIADGIISSNDKFSNLSILKIAALLIKQ